MSKDTIKDKLVIGSSIGGDTEMISQLIYSNLDRLKKDKESKTAPLSSDKWNKIAEQLARYGLKNCEYTEGLAVRYGVSKEQVQSVVDEIEGAIE